LKAVLDSGVLLSALAGHSGSPSGKLVAGIRAGTLQALACPRLIAELRDGLRKPYFARRVGEQEAGEEVAAIERAAVMLADPVELAPTLRDPRDDYLIALARAGGAEAIVTGDKDLLEHPGIEPEAITPRQACERLGLIGKQAH
jgi:putative PIN family toxin of toxin-antitoxin system